MKINQEIISQMPQAARDVLDFYRNLNDKERGVFSLE
jgi:hypothetical protein